MSSVDVVIPCYNYGHLLRGCVRSVLSQPGVDVRVLVIDDCSPDDTAGVGAELAAADNRVEFRRHSVNHGHIRTYNEGLLEWAAGDYSVLLSADDLLAPGALGRAARLMDAHPEAGFVYGREIRTNAPEHDATPIPSTYETRVTSGAEFLERMCREGANFVPTPSVVVRTALQKRLGGYLPELPHAGDMEMWLRFAAHAAVGFVDNNQAYYRTHGQQMSTRYPGLRDIEQRKAVFDTFFRNYADGVPGHEALRRAAAAELGAAAFWGASRSFDEGRLDESAQYVRVALEIDPGLRRTRRWAQFRCKQIVGPRLWRTLKPVLRPRRAHSAV
jgi:glycosyltransferase involved in cell wall biosynthesis